MGYGGPKSNLANTLL